jgi:hypothetical protein
MFDWQQRGDASTHRYRGFYDAGEGSAIRCAQCNRAIRHCYSMHDRHAKSFVIGTCCFRNYSGKTLLRLDAAKLLQEATRNAVVRDTRLYGALTGIRERRRQWSRARREALGLLRMYRKSRKGSGWLPRELFDLQVAVRSLPREYKRKACALRWYEAMTKRLVDQAGRVAVSPDFRQV